MTNKLGDYDYIIDTYCKDGKFILSIEVGSHIIRKVVDRYIDETGVQVKRYWNSKYNNFVSYDYEPFCVEGFNICTVFEFNTYNKREWCKFLMERHIKRISELEKLYLVCIDARTK